MRLYLDSSVLVAVFAPEAFTNRALDILNGSSELVISELTLTENTHITVPEAQTWRYDGCRSGLCVGRAFRCRH